MVCVCVEGVCVRVVVSCVMCGLCRGVWCVRCKCRAWVQCVAQYGAVFLLCVLCACWCVCGTRHQEHAVSVQGRAYMQLIGWQNTWEQAPGVPATPSPP